MYMLQDIIDGTLSLPLQYTMIDVIYDDGGLSHETNIVIQHKIPIYKELYLELYISETINALEVWSPLLKQGRNSLINTQWSENKAVSIDESGNPVIDISHIIRKLYVSWYGKRFLGNYASSVTHYIEMHLERLYMIAYRILKDNGVK